MSTWLLSKSFRFESSHQLVKHDGKCAQLHGHSWKGELVVGGHYLQSTGAKENMVVDFGHLSLITEEIEQQLDHKHLNVVLQTDMPTSEFVARWIFKQVKDKLNGQPIWLHKVAVEETCTSRCQYSEQ